MWSEATCLRWQIGSATYHLSTSSNPQRKKGNREKVESWMICSEWTRATISKSQDRCIQKCLPQTARAFHISASCLSSLTSAKSHLGQTLPSPITPAVWGGGGRAAARCNFVSRSISACYTGKPMNIRPQSTYK